MSVFESDLVVRRLAEQLEAKQRELEELRRELDAWQERVARGEVSDVNFT